MFVYTIKKSDLYEGSVEPEMRYQDSDGDANSSIDYIHIMAQILIDLDKRTSNITEGES